MEILLISLLTFIGAFIGTLSGFGLSTLMLPVMLIFTPYSVALLLVGIIHFFGNLWKVILFRKGLDAKILIYFGIPGIISSFIGAKIVLNYSPDKLTRLLGLLLMLYVFLIVFEPKLKLRQTRTSSFLGGAMSGIFAGIFGTGGAVRSAFLNTYNLRKDVYLFSSGAIALLIDSSRILTYLSGGVRLNRTLGLGLLIFIPISFFAADIAKKTVDRISQKKFKILVALFIFLVGIKLLIYP